MIPEQYLKLFLIVLLFQTNCILVKSYSATFGNQLCGQRVIELKENEQLELICVSDEERPIIEFHSKGASPWSKRHQSLHQMIVHNSTYGMYNETFIAVFRIDKLLFGDGGDYECLADITGCMRILVQSDESFFAEKNILPLPKISLDMNRKEGFEPIFFNCMPTSRDLELVYFIDMKRINKPSTPYLRAEFPGLYTCQLKRNKSVVAEKSFKVIDGKCSTSQPKITGHLLPHATRNQTLRINCTIKGDLRFHRKLSWHLKEKDLITTRSYMIPNPEFANCATIIKELELKKVDDDNVVGLRCTAQDKKLTGENTSIQLKIHNDNFTECKLSLSPKNDYRGIITKNVEVVILIDSYPHTPEITWKDRNANAVVEREGKIIIETNEMQTKLTIKNFSSSDDVNYTVEAKTPDHLVSKSFRLEVWENPFVKYLNNVMPYYMQNTTARIDCITLHTLEPEITWSFEPNLDSLPPLSEEEIEDIRFTSSNESVTWTIQSSGNLSCNACISLIDGSKECYTVIRQILMTDVPDGFGIIGPKEELMVGDRLELICAASVYHYTDQIEWMNSDGSALDIGGRISINRTRTRLNYRSILIIDPVQESDNNESYFCSSNRAYAETKANANGQTYLLTTRMPELRMNQTNLNGTKSIYRRGTSIDLWCYARGNPEIRVTWWRNNIQIFDTTFNRTDVCHYSLKNNGQQLHVASADEVCEGFYSCRGTNKFNMSVVNNQTIKIESPEVETDENTIFVVVVVISIAVVMTIFLSSVVYIRVGTSRTNKKLKQMCLENFAKGVPEFLNPELPMGQQAAFLPYGAKYEFSIRKLEFGKILGAGNFGTVVKAKAKGIRKGEIVTTVAVKTAEPEYIKDLANELKIMVYLGNHENLVSLLGACTKNIVKGELLVITEYCCFGSLHNCLQRHKPNFINQIDLATGKIDFSIGPDLSGQSIGNNKSKPHTVGLSEPMSNHSSIYATHIIDQEDDADHDNFPVLNTYVLLWWSWQIARGMDYLAEKRVLHRDLAARNILLTEGNVVKICDFGLSKSLPDKDYYRVSTRDELPSAWLSLQSLDFKIFTTESDVWTFGVVLWELFTLGQRPYDDRNRDAICEFLRTGDRLKIPVHANEDIYNVMKECWNVEPKLRPTFRGLMKQIRVLLGQSERKLLTNLKKSQ